MVPDFSKKQKRNPNKKFLLMMGTILILATIVVLVVADAKIYKRKQELNNQIENLKNKIQELQNSNNQLKQDIENTNNNTYIEKVAREELDLQQPGEKVVSFIKDESQQQNPENQKDVFQLWIAGFGDFWNQVVGWFK